MTPGERFAYGLIFTALAVVVAIDLFALALLGSALWRFAEAMEAR